MKEKGKSQGKEWGAYSLFPLLKKVLKWKKEVSVLGKWGNFRRVLEMC